MTILRPLGPADAVALDREQSEPGFGGEFLWWGFRASPGRGETATQGPRLAPEGGRLAVAADDGSLVGEVMWFPASWGPALPGVVSWELGILLLPEHRGRGHGSAAQQLLAGYLFDHTTANRVQATTDVANRAEQRALDKAGFTREAVVRGAQWRGGEWRDLVLFAKLRGDA